MIARTAVLSGKYLSIASEEALRGHLVDEYPIAIDSANGVLVKLDEVERLGIELPQDMALVVQHCSEESADWVYFDFTSDSSEPDLEVLR
jgi:hypothetical protein